MPLHHSLLCINSADHNNHGVLRQDGSRRAGTSAVRLSVRVQCGRLAAGLLLVWCAAESWRNQETQWRPQEGCEPHKRLRELFEGGIGPTDILVIAPFRAVANQVRNTFAGALQQCTGCNSSEANRLASSQAGTFHTSQGREANVVFIVLGSRAGKGGEGSRLWVNGSPNLLNVAMSRAKRRVYVIGNLADWKN